MAAAARWSLALCCACAVGSALTRTVTIRNDQPRIDVDGNYIDAHDGMILAHNGTYYLYGEAYLNQTLATPYPWKTVPRLRVYTSPDLVSWTLRGDPLPMVTGTLWIPNVFFHAPTQRFIMWFGSGGWNSATSIDGIHFTPSKYGPFNSRVGGTDGTGVLIDDDGVGYVAFASMPPGFDSHTHPGWPGHVAHNAGHIVSIERLTPDLLSSTKVNVTGWFPDDYVESPSLFKRNGTYYLTYGSCCCGCAEGGGQVVFTAPAIEGPWKRQAPHADINCYNSTADICGGYGARAGELQQLVYNAQWWGPSWIPLAGGKMQTIFIGRRWLSGPNHPDGCFDICGNRGGKKAACVSSAYQLKTDFSVWYPVEFDDETAAILPFKPTPSFILELPSGGLGPE